MPEIQPISLAHQQERLVQRCRQEREEYGDDFSLPVQFDLDSAIAIVGNLQLALRHPGNTGASAQIARRLIDGIIAWLREAGFVAHAELARLGDDPEHDL